MKCILKLDALSSRSLIKSTALLTLLSFFIVISARAQDSKPKQEFTAIALGIGGGIDQYNFNGINSHLKTVGLPTLKNNLFSFDGDIILFLPKKNHGLFTDITVYGGGYKTNQGSTTLLYGVEGSDVNLNYLIINNRQKLYPSIGYGAAQMTTKFSSNPEPQTFNSAATTFGEREFDIKRLSYVVAKVNYSYTVTKDGFLTIKLTGGYRLGLNNKQWSLLSGSLSDNVRTNATGYDLSLGVVLRVPE